MTTMGEKYSILWTTGKTTDHDVNRIISTDEVPEGYFIQEFKACNYTLEKIIYDPQINIFLTVEMTNIPGFQIGWVIIAAFCACFVSFKFSKRRKLKVN